MALRWTARGASRAACPLRASRTLLPLCSGEPGKALSRGITCAEQTSAKTWPGDGTQFTGEGGGTTPEWTPSWPGHDPDSDPEPSLLSEPCIS